MNMLSVKWMAAVLLAMAGMAMGQTYAMKAGTPLIYEVTITTEMPNTTRVTVGYLVYKPASVDAANGQTKLNCTWGVYSVKNQVNGQLQGNPGATPAFLSKEALAKPSGPEIVIDQRGTVVRADSSAGDAQLGDGLGPAAELMLQPLPPAGKQRWTVERKLTMYHETRENTGPQRGPWAAPQKVTRVETPAEESISYNAATAFGGTTIVQRKYRLASLEKAGDTPVNEMTGDGYYVFNPDLGAIESCEYKLSSVVNAKNLSVKVPITVSAKLIAPETLAKFQEELIARQKKIDEDRKKQEEVAKERAKNISGTLPANMERTEAWGYEVQRIGAPTVLVNPRGLPMIGIKFSTADWFGQNAFRGVEPIYETPTRKDDGITYVLAKEGYVVTSITLNGPNSINAMYVTFAKKTGDTTVDEKTAYNSPWLGKRNGEMKKKLGGGGKVVFGLACHHGLNFDTMALIVPAGAAQDEPAKDEPASDEPAKDEPATDEPAKTGAAPAAAKVEPPKTEPKAPAVPRGDSRIVRKMADGMEKSELVGYHPEQGGTMLQMNSAGLPMIGVKYVVGNWGGKPAFRVFEPVFEAPTEKKPGEVYVLAKDGFVVTSITVNGMPNNGTPGVTALYLTFAKLDGDKVDPKTAYNSPWLGQRVGEGRKTLGGNGRVVYGICGRHGMNLDNLGVITKVAGAKAESR